MPRKKSPQPPVTEVENLQSNEQLPPPSNAKEVEMAYYTKEGYKVEEEAMGMVHVRTSTFTVQRGTFDKSTHKKDHILDPQMWEICRKQWPDQGIHFVEMLHYPIGTEVGFVTPE